MILTHSPVETERLTHSATAKLKECSKVNAFTESGWFYAFGWKGGVLHVKVHCNSRSEYESAMGIGNYSRENTYGFKAHHPSR